MSQYIFTATKGPVSWTQAADRAVAQGGQLASVSSADEDNFILAVLSEHDDLWHYDPRDNALNGPWIGLFQPEGSPEPGGGWSWLDGGGLTYDGWHSTQPDNFLPDTYGLYWEYQDQIGWADHTNEPDTEFYGPVQSYITEFGDAVVNLKGSADNDYIYGGAIANQIRAGKGNDWISGGEGGDTLYGE